MNHWIACEIKFTYITENDTKHICCFVLYLMSVINKNFIIMFSKAMYEYKHNVVIKIVKLYCYVLIRNVNFTRFLQSVKYFLLEEKTCIKEKPWNQCNKQTVYYGASST